MSGLVLTACANNGTVPKNNETPMEKVEDRTRDLTPNVNNGQTGPNMDGLENEKDVTTESLMTTMEYVMESLIMETNNSE